MGEVEVLSLRDAAVHAGVSENTMREWVKRVSGVERNSTGGYMIPKESLMGYLATKSSQVRGSRPGASYSDNPAQVSHQVPGAQELMVKLLDQIEGERDRLRAEVVEVKKAALEAQSRANQRIDELENRNSELSTNFTHLADTVKLLETSHRAGMVTPHSIVQNVKKTVKKAAKSQKTRKAKPKKKAAVKAKPKAKAKSKVKKR